MPNTTQHQGTRGKVANNRETMCQKPTTPLRWARTRYDFINSSYFSTELFLLDLRARLYQEGTGSGARKAHIITLQPAGEAFIFLAALHSRSIAHTAMPSPLLPGTRWVVQKKMRISRLWLHSANSAHRCSYSGMIDSPSDWMLPRGRPLLKRAEKERKKANAPWFHKLTEGNKFSTTFRYRFKEPRATGGTNRARDDDREGLQIYNLTPRGASTSTVSWLGPGNTPTDHGGTPHSMQFPFSVENLFKFVILQRPPLLVGFTRKAWRQKSSAPFASLPNFHMTDCDNRIPFVRRVWYGRDAREPTHPPDKLQRDGAFLFRVIFATTVSVFGLYMQNIQTDTHT